MEEGPNLRAPSVAAQQNTRLLDWEILPNLPDPPLDMCAENKHFLQLDRSIQFTPASSNHIPQRANSCA